MTTTIRRAAKDPAEQRQEVIRRIQIGGVGLGLVLLLVALATLLTGEARQQAEVAKAQAQAAGVANPGTAPVAGPTDDPLAELGVERSVDANTAAAPVVPSRAPQLPATAPLTADPIVPDLQPDPDLKGASARR